MLGWICFLLLFCGGVASCVTGAWQEVCRAILETPEEAVRLILSTGGSVCFFCGILQVAENAGLVEKFSRLLRRPVRWLIPRARSDAELCRAVTLNLSSNFFGLGNAATPCGIRATERMTGTVTDRSIACFLILNTCSVQLIPSAVCALRQAEGSSDPTGILPAVWIVQILSCAFGIVLVRCVFREK